VYRRQTKPGSLLETTVLSSGKTPVLSTQAAAFQAEGRIFSAQAAARAEEG